MTDTRSEARCNMYLAAVLSAQQCSSPAKIRNMSPTGALVDAPIVPPVGAAVRLTRGSLAAEGQIAWATEGRCGIRFRSLVIVRDWIALPTNREQARVDETVALVKAGAIPLPLVERQRSSQGDEGTSLGAQLAADLCDACALIDSLGSDLAANSQVVSCHAQALQGLDAVRQTLEVVIASLRVGSLGEQGLLQRLGNLRAARTAIVDRARG